MIYLLTVNYNSSDLINRLLESLKANECDNYQLIIVNNSPEDHGVNKLTTYPYVRILEAKNNLGFGGGCNLGLNWIYTQNPSALVWLINPDTYFTINYLKKTQLFFVNYPEIAILGTIIYTPDHKIWFGGGDFIAKFGAIICRESSFLSNNQDYFCCDWVSGCSMLINLNKFANCPQFDTNYFLYYEDFDFCRRYFNEGAKIAFTNKISVIHQPSSITNRNIINKLKYSTYSYLLTLKKYSNTLVFSVRLLRLVIYSIILLPIKPQASFGKIAGISKYFLSYFQ